MTEDATREIENFLNKLSESGTGAVVVANIARAMASNHWIKPQIGTILQVWLERINVHLESINLNPAVTAKTGRITLDDLESINIFNLTLGRPGKEHDMVWECILEASDSPSTTVKPWEQVSTVKRYSEVCTYLLEHEPVDPHSDPRNPVYLKVDETTDLEDLQQELEKIPLKPAAMIHHKKWFWITDTTEVERFVGTELANAERLSDALGLIHMSQSLSTKQPRERLLIEIQLDGSYAPRPLKPAFAFADTNPRFVTWHTPPQSAAECGFAVDLAAFDTHKRVDCGLPEYVCFRPRTLTRQDIKRLVPRGFLCTDRWGDDPTEPRDTVAFASQLCGSKPMSEVIAEIVNEFRTR